MMRSSLQAGPSIKYEVVSLQAGSSDLMRSSLQAGPSIKYEVVNLQAGSSFFFFDEKQPPSWPFYKIRSCKPPSWFLGYFGWGFEVNILIFIQLYIYTSNFHSMMRSSLQAGPSIKYEVVSLLAGSSFFFFDEMQPPSWPIYKIRSCEPPSWFLGFDEMQPLQSWPIYKIRSCEPPSWFLWISWMGVRSLNEY